MARICVTLPTLESRNHITGDIERGIKLYESGTIEIKGNESGCYTADITENSDCKHVTVQFTRDGSDLKSFHCDGCADSKDGLICRHVTAAVLAAQGGIAETKLTLGKTANATTAVTAANTAKSVGSGNLEVFATPMMIALMERAACLCLADALENGQTSVGTHISVDHTAASPLGAEITASAEIKRVFGRKIEFTVSASDGKNEIGKGVHTRVIVDENRFMSKVSPLK